MRRLLTTLLGGGLSLGIALTPVAAEAAPSAPNAVVTTVDTAAKSVKVKYPRPGQKGAKVKALQRRLIKVGLLRKVTGKYAKGTRRAVKRFQRRQHIKVTGKVNARTWRLLVAATKPARQPPPPLPLLPAPLVVAHRGVVGIAGIGENTLAAMEYAADNGARVLEFDVRWTSDHVPVAMHDTTLDRTTNCAGNVSSQTWAYLETNCRVGTQPIPKIEEITDLARDRGLTISPEIKKKQAPSKVQIDALMPLIDGLPTYLQSFYGPPIEAMRSAGYTGAMVFLTNNPVVPQAVPAGTTIIGQLISSTLTPTLVAAYRNAGYGVWAWTARTTAELTTVRTLGMDAVVADNAPWAQSFYAGQR